MIINLVLFFIPKRQEIYRLYLIKKRKKLAYMMLNSKTQMSVYCETDLLIYAESLYTGRYFFNITNKTKNSPCDYGFCIIYIVNRDRKIIVYDKTTNNVYVNTRMDSGTAWIGWRKA